MEYTDFLTNQRALIDANARLTEYAKERQNQQNALEQAEMQYAAMPQGTGMKAMIAGAGAGVGAGIGAGIGAMAKKPLGGALYGGLGGLAMAAGVGSGIVNRSLDKKHPERVEAREGIYGARENLSEIQQKHEQYDQVYDRSLAYNAGLAADNPDHYLRAVNELGEQYPIGDMNSAVGDVEYNRAMQEYQQREERAKEIEAQSLQNNILKEELMKQKMKNEKRLQSVQPVTKEALVNMREEMNKIAMYFA